MKDSLWSVDLFRCESMLLKSHWVMVVIDQYTRQIIGFAVNPGDCDGVSYCRMFNEIISGKSLPRREYLDHMLFFNERDLQKKLDQFQEYYNETRAHSSLEMKTPVEMTLEKEGDKTVVSLDRYRWNLYCKELYQLPVAA